MHGCHLDGELVAWASVVIEEDVGILKCLVVHPDYRGQGIGKELTNIRLQYLKNQGCKYVKSYAWVRPDGQLSIMWYFRK